MFDAQNVKNQAIRWIKEQFEGTEHNAIIGISGGKDSSVVAALCAEALGTDRVFGIIMPNGKMEKENLAIDICDYIGIRYRIIDIKDAVDGILYGLEDQELVLSRQAKINTPPRIRMTTLYAVAATLYGRVVGTSNASEIHLGYSTKWGDGVCDLNPLGGLTCSEVIEVGKLLFPKELIDIPPADDLTGKTDEENFGFTYAEVDAFIREGVRGKNIDKIQKMYNESLHKKRWIPIFNPITPRDSLFHGKCPF